LDGRNPRRSCPAFGWSQNRNSAAGHDAVDAAGVRYEIKARRLTPHSQSRQLSVIRNLKSKPFDQLAAVLVDENFQTLRDR